MRRSGLRALMVVQGIHGLYRCRLEHTVLHRRRKIHAPGVDGGKIGGGLHGHGGTGGRYQHTVGHAPDKPAFGVHADKGRQRDDQNGNDDFEHLLSPLRNAETDHAASPSGKPPVSKRRRGPRRYCHSRPKSVRGRRCGTHGSKPLRRSERLFPLLPYHFTPGSSWNAARWRAAKSS